MIRRLALFTILGLGCLDVCAQSRTISGYVRDQANGESIIGASIFDNRQDKGTASNNFGYYSLTTRYDSAILTVSFVGYDVSRLKIRITHDTTMVILLRGKVLDEVVVRGDQTEGIHETSRTGTVNLPMAQIKAIPTFAGEQDVMRALQLVPGVSGGAEGSANLLIRGGTPDQTLILMDGVPIYNPTHLYGFFSAFNPDAVNNVELVKSGFPARYGGRLSGVTDITLREGNVNKFSGQATVGLLSSRLMLEGPIFKGKTSFLLSGRVSYISLMKGLLAEKVGNASLDGYQFHDINAKINHRINAADRIYASLYSGSDQMVSRYTNETNDSIGSNTVEHNTSTATDKMGWSNLLASFRWNHELSSTGFFNVTAYMSSYALSIENYNGTHSETEPDGTTTDAFNQYKWQTKIRDFGVKVDFDYIPSPKHYIRYGLAGIRHDFTPGVSAKRSSDSEVTPVPVNSSSTTFEQNAYVEDDINVNSKLKANVGLHAVSYSATGKIYQGLQPRASMRYSLPGNLALKASYSYMQQFLQTLSNAGIGFPVEVWTPSTATIKPQTSQQVAVGAAKTSGDIEISVEGFYKKLDNLVEYKEGASYLDNDKPWYDKVTQGRGKAYGVELFVQKKVGRITGFAGYTLSWNKRQFDDLNRGQWYYARYDHRHDFKATVNYRFNKHFDASASFLFATGSAVTAPVGRFASGFPGGGGPFVIDEYESRGNYRMQSYHRLDLSVNYIINTARFEHKASVGLYNAYDRLNPFYIQYDQNYNRYVSVSLFPIMPAGSYSIKF